LSILSKILRRSTDGLRMRENGSQQGRVGGITERPVEWHGEDLGSYQNGHADFESGKFPQPPKSASDPMAAEPGNPLTI